MGTFHSVCGSPSTRGAEDARSNVFPFLIPSGDTIFMRQSSCRIWSSSARCKRRTHCAKASFVNSELKISHWSVESAEMAVRRPSELKSCPTAFDLKDRKHVF
jgi:hypothetical protein